MEIKSYNFKPLSPEELKDLEKLRILLERAIADGVVTRSDMDAIDAHIYADKDKEVLYEELKLCRQLVWDKIQKGEIEYGWW